MLGGVLAAGLLAGLLVGGWSGVALGMGVALGLLLLADRRAHLGHLLADWTFARDLAAGARPDLAARIARFAAEVAAARRAREVDEVVLTGHSLGMVLLAQALAQALRDDPEPPRPAPRLVLVGLGSSLLKIALMPQAAALRAAVADIAVAQGLAWLEYTSRRDLVSFHRADPVAVLGLPGRGPRMERIHPRAMLDAAAWRRVRLSMLRAHRIYVTGNGRRYFYDWGMIACGPGAAGRDATPDRLIGPDGRLRAALPEAAT
jgi:pimeloyl-ACP methyl ester carboxylesterase